MDQRFLGRSVNQVVLMFAREEKSYYFLKFIGDLRKWFLFRRIIVVNKSFSPCEIVWMEICLSSLHVNCHFFTACT